MRHLTIAAVALAALTGSAVHSQTPNPPCNRRMIVSPDSLRDIARRLHPESADSTKAGAFLTVGLIFDAECRLVRHAAGSRTGPSSAGVALARLIPDAAGRTYVTSGFVELPVAVSADSTRRQLARADGVDRGSPWVVWGVQQQTPRR